MRNVTNPAHRPQNSVAVAVRLDHGHAGGWHFKVMRVLALGRDLDPRFLTIRAFLNRREEDRTADGDGGGDPA